MKTSSKFLALLAASAFAFSPVALHAQDQPPPPPMDNGAPPPPDQSAPPPPDASGDDNTGASFQQFYDQLGSQGQWIQTPNYGYAFQPTVADPNWAPYTDGHWAYTDCGWTWVSDEPWGWATYHYGRWVNIDGTGWVWVPGYTWAPAWVSWRYGGGYCGWAPLPPATLIGVDFAQPGLNIGIGFSFGSDCDTSFGIGAGCYNFIPVTYIGEPYYHGYYLDRSRNFVVINQTRNITNIRYYSGRPVFGGVTVGGPSLAEVNAHARTHLDQVRLTAAGSVGASTIAGGALNIYAPRFNPATVRQARPATVARTLSTVKVNRGTSITHPLEVNAGLKPVAPSAEAIRAAQEAQAKVPAGAHIATAKTVPKTTLSKPLTSLSTAEEVRRTQPSASTILKAEQSNELKREDAVKQEQTQAQARDAAKQEETDAALKKEQAEAKARDASAQEETDAALKKEQAEAKARDAASQEERDAALKKEQTQAQTRDAAEQEERNQARKQEQAEARARAASTEHAATQEHAPVVQQHAPVVQEHAPAPQPHPAAAQGAGAKNKNANNP